MLGDEPSEDHEAAPPPAVVKGALVYVHLGGVWHGVVLTREPTPAEDGGVILWGVEDPLGAARDEGYRGPLS